MGAPPKDRKGSTSIRLFQKNLRDMITGIRSHKDKQKDFMNKCLQDIRAEVSRTALASLPTPLVPRSGPHTRRLRMLTYVLARSGYRILFPRTTPGDAPKSNPIQSDIHTGSFPNPSSSPTGGELRHPH